MNHTHDPLGDHISQIISQEIHQTLGFRLAPQEIWKELGLAPNLQWGHLAFPCFRLSRELKKDPHGIAHDLSQAWRHQEGLKEVKAEGPYLNLSITAPLFGKTLLAPMVEGSYFKCSKAEGSPFLIEYSQPNTHKELHVGHMRNLCFGQALTLLFEYCGHPVVSCTFPGDVGTHVAKCLWYLKFHNKEALPDKGRGQWLGQLYTKAHHRWEEDRGTPREQTNGEQLTHILKQIQEKKGEFFELWQETRQWSVDLMEEVYQWAGVSFDKWYWESDVDKASVELVKGLHKQGKLVEDKGALGLHMEDENLGFAMFLKSDGNGLYSTKDLELARRKFEEYSPRENIVVVDMRQELHFRQVFGAFGKLGLGPSSQCRHLKYNFVELPEGPMSSRQGNIIPLTDLIEKMKRTIRTDYLEKSQEDWTEQEMEKTADQVAQGAIKYGMNRMDPNKKIVFDMKEWLRLDGESGPYIQYTHARIHSLLQKHGEERLCDEKKNRAGKKEASPPHWALLTHEREIELILHLSLFNGSMSKSLEAYKTSGVCHYLYNLAKLFNSFYQSCPVGTLEDKELKRVRLTLVWAVKEALRKGLAILGIPAVNRM